MKTWRSMRRPGSRPPPVARHVALGSASQWIPITPSTDRKHHFVPALASRDHDFGLRFEEKIPQDHQIRLRSSGQP